MGSLIIEEIRERHRDGAGDLLHPDQADPRPCVPADRGADSTRTRPEDAPAGRVMYGRSSTLSRLAGRRSSIGRSLSARWSAARDLDKVRRDGDGRRAGGRTARPARPHPYALVHIRADMESFMGVDGRVYALKRGDIVTLPENNADVLCERDIALNIRLNK